ncbi:MAG: serine hydrolase domain-containing protein, partial [Aurantibacter sp.]
MRPRIYFLFVLSFVIIGCSSDNNGPEPSPDPDPQPLGMYFPPSNSDLWETTTIAELQWNADAEQPLYDLLEEKDTKAFLILKEGRIVVENYFGTFTKDSLWYWASAGKTLTSFTVGIAQEQGLLGLDDKSSDYLGQGWTTETLGQENLITVRHQLTMTTGIKDTPLNFDCKIPSCLPYEADAGTRWAYHNAPYT